MGRHVPTLQVDRICRRRRLCQQAFLWGVSLTGVSEESKNKAPGNASLPGLCDLLVLEGILNFSKGNKKVNEMIQENGKI